MDCEKSVMSKLRFRGNDRENQPCTSMLPLRIPTIKH